MRMMKRELNWGSGAQSASYQVVDMDDKQPAHKHTPGFIAHDPQRRTGSHLHSSGVGAHTSAQQAKGGAGNKRGSYDQCSSSKL